MSILHNGKIKSLLLGNISCAIWIYYQNCPIRKDLQWLCTMQFDMLPHDDLWKSYPNFTWLPFPICLSWKINIIEDKISNFKFWGLWPHLLSPYLALVLYIYIYIYIYTCIYTCIWPGASKVWHLVKNLISRNGNIFDLFLRIMSSVFKK